MLRTRLSGLIAGLVLLGCCAQAADFFGENLVQVKLALPKGDTYIRGATDPVLDLVADITLVNTSEKEKLDKETVAATKADFLSVDELVAIGNALKKEEGKDAALKIINEAAEKKTAKADKEAYPVNPKSLGVAYVEPRLGPYENVAFVITKLPEEGEAVPEGAKPVIIPRIIKPDSVSWVDVASDKYLVAGESSPAYPLPVGKFYLIRDPGLYSIKAVLLGIGDNSKGGKFAESNEEKFRILPFKAVDQKIEELQRNWEFYERGYPSFDYQLYEVKTSQGRDEVYWVQRIMVLGFPKWEWGRLCSVKQGTQAQVAFLAPKKYAVLAVQERGDIGLYTLDFSTVGPTVTPKIMASKEGAAPKLKVEAGVPSVE